MIPMSYIYGKAEGKNRKLRENRRHRCLAYAAKIECFLVAILANYFAIFSQSLPAFFLYLIHFLYESGTIKKRSIDRSRFFFQIYDYARSSAQQILRICSL
jgi:hypothetical protein